MTEEEKKAKLADLREKLVQKRAVKAKEDAKENLANEAIRRKAGRVSERPLATRGHNLMHHPHRTSTRFAKRCSRRSSSRKLRRSGKVCLRDPPFVMPGYTSTNNDAGRET